MGPRPGASFVRSSGPRRLTRTGGGAQAAQLNFQALDRGTSATVRARRTAVPSPRPPLPAASSSLTVLKMESCIGSPTLNSVLLATPRPSPCCSPSLCSRRGRTQVLVAVLAVLGLAGACVVRHCDGPMAAVWADERSGAARARERERARRLVVYRRLEGGSSGSSEEERDAGL